MAESSSTRAALVNVTVENADALDCGVCCLPLKPPIFQCPVGHVLCSPCRDKMAAAKRCHMCRIPTGKGGYRRCHDMEKLLESIRVPCANAAHGCTEVPAYYNGADHLAKCQHAPCYCPGDGCGFAGTTAALLDHFTAVHEWPSTTVIRPWERSSVQLRDGFNVLDVHVFGKQYPILLNVVKNPFGRAVAAFCLLAQAAVLASSSTSSPATSRSVGFSLRLEYSDDAHKPGDMSCGHTQETKFAVACTDLSGGWPSSEDCFQFFVPKSVHPLDRDAITVQFTILGSAHDLAESYKSDHCLWHKYMSEDFFLSRTLLLLSRPSALP